MKEFDVIRSLYNPVQPTVSRSGGTVTYEEFASGTPLQNIIYCYWQLKTEQPLQDVFNYRVVADGCIDVFFDLNQPSDSFVMGFCKKYTEFPLDNNFNYVGIRFLPSMFPQLFKIDASELSNKYERLELVLPVLAAFIKDHLGTRLNLSQMAKLLDDFFLKGLPHIEWEFDPRFYQALNLILSSSGTHERIAPLDTGISPRQLRRIFNYYLGTSPKTFSKVVRFQNILRAKPSTQSLKRNKLFYNVGYYDQAHFIKDFKNFYGVTPTRAFR